ncbi:MAG: type II toxin-antitoxin system VapC family toxin [Burkholderiaceae bacterium]|jgi:predicted nucleic acid-binding protein|nr:type II toxin-antitoxin system VapC family toxin [Gemmatimonadales bacterium]MCO5118786.1 type II toxin-antitoxin system VapC family toxin [Burkholderiaceae bacterium]MEB2320459.1 type II toxin-antitoxin system VapC family toxin [Pseudomonadota bacterium]
MIIADTSVWVAHLRQPSAVLGERLENSGVLLHPFILGELALGGVSASTLKMLQDLPQCRVASPDEVLALIAATRLSGRGIGYVDTHLIASARMASDTRLWSLDQRLNAVAGTLGIGYSPQA